MARPKPRPKIVSFQNVEPSGHNHAVYKVVFNRPLAMGVYLQRHNRYILLVALQKENERASVELYITNEELLTSKTGWFTGWIRSIVPTTTAEQKLTNTAFLKRALKRELHKIIDP